MSTRKEFCSKVLFMKSRRQVLECLRVAARGGGYVLASDHSIHEGVPSDNVKYVFKIARKHGRCPLTRL